MTGTELLKQDLLKQGFTKAQAESKVVTGVLGIVSGEPERYITILEDEKRAEEARKEAERVLSDAKRFEARVNENYRKYLSLEEKLREYIDSFNAAIENMDTEEGKDRLRIAQVFVNTVNIDTKYDNTAFIIGLASLLAGVKIDPVKELKKINKNLTVDHVVE